MVRLLIWGATLNYACLAKVMGSGNKMTNSQVANLCSAFSAAPGFGGAISGGI